MSYARGTCACHDNDRSKFGPFDGDSQETNLNNNLDSECNKETDQLLSVIKDEFKSNSFRKCEFLNDINHAKLIPYWYQEMLQSKIKEAKRRLKSLSNIVSNICTSTGAHIKRVESDHNVTFCKMDCPRYPILDQPWTNSWKFVCVIRCKETDKPNRTHTDNCESYILLEHSDTRVSTATSNISPMEYPEYVMNAIKLFQDFASDITGNKFSSDPSNFQNAVHDKFMWSTIELTVRSNYLNQIMLVIHGKKIALFTHQLQKYFESGPGRNSNVISVLCIDQNRSKNKRNKPIKLTSISELNDQVGSILIQYDAKTNNSFNSVEIIQLQKLIEDYVGLSEENALLDISCCNFGILALMMSHKCEKVIGLNVPKPISLHFSQIEKFRLLNNIHNVTFIDCDPENILLGCSHLIEQYRTVAVLNLSSPYGKSRKVMQALRDIPNIWKVIVYGPFTNDFHAYISILTSKDDSVYECYLPVSSCILDKLPTAKNAFDIAILFERKSLVAPKLEPLSPISDIEPDYDSLDVQENLQQQIRNEDIKPKLETDNYDLLNTQENLHQSRNEYIESDSKTHSSDLLGSQENLQQLRNEHIESDMETHNYDLLDSDEILLHQENPFLRGNFQESGDEQLSYSYLYGSPTPPREKYPSPPPPPPLSPPPPPLPSSPLSLPISGSLLHTSQIKIEKEEFHNCKNVASSVTITSKSASFCERSFKALNDNNEVLDMEVSPNPQVTEMSKTPIRKKKVLKKTVYSPPKPIFTNITLNDFQFTVQANKSYLNFKRDPEQSNVKNEFLGGEWDEEIKIIVEKKSDKRKKLKPQIRVQTLSEIMKMRRASEDDDDLHILYEKRNEILEQLKEDKETNYCKDSHSRHSRSDLPRRRQSSSSSSSRSSRKHNYSLSPGKHKSPSSKRRRQVP